MLLLKIAFRFNGSKLSKLLAVTVIYALTYQLIADYLAPKSSIDLFFIASGIALASLLLGGRVYALSVFFGCVLANLSSGLSFWVTITIATGVTLGVLLGEALVTHKNNFDLSLQSLPDYLRLIFFGGFLGSSVGALIGTTALEIAHLIPQDQYAIELLRWLMDDVLGVVLITPLILVWQKMPIRHLPTLKNSLKIAFVICVTWLMGQIVFLGWFSETLSLVAKGYWLFGVIALTAAYLGRQGTLLISLMVTAQAMIGAIQGVGFFAEDLEQTKLLNLYCYVTNLSLVGIALAIHIDKNNSIARELRDSEEKFKSIFDQAPLGIGLVDSLTGQIYAANPMFAKIAGREIEEVLDINRMNMTHPDDIQKDLDNMSLMIAGKINRFSMQKRYIRPDGSIIWVNLSVAPMLVEDQTKPRHHCIIEDITERKQLEDAQLFLLECGYKQSGEDFFASLARYLADILEIDCVCIVRLEADGLEAETVAIYTDGYFEKNVCYTLQTPVCVETVGRGIDFSDNVRNLFPDNIVLQEMLPESYIGTTLSDFEGKPNGLIALMGRKPLKNKHLAEALLKLVAIRAAGELERRKAETELQIAATIFESHEGMFVTNAEQIILKVNHAFTKITGYTATEAVGQTPRLFRSGQHDSSFYYALWLSLNYTGVWQGEIWNRRKNDEVYPQWLTITTVKASKSEIVTHYVATLIDISDRKQTEEQIKHLAFYDALTNLPNRRALSERMKYSINLARRENKQMAVLMLDLDKFKPVNDRLGHAAGDLLLQQVAERIKAHLRDIDMVARLGGDEFVILLDEISQYEDVSRIAKDIISNLNQPFILQNDRVQIGASIGISLYPQHGLNPDILIDNADTALYLAKNQGRGCFAYFTEELTQQAHQRIALETRLGLAIEKQEFCLHYQPQIDISTGQIIGAEALIRWQDPNRGLICPNDFMPIAETSNLFLQIAEWVLIESCKQGQQWLEAGLPKLMLTVNMSPQQFHRGNLNELVANTLAETGFPAAQLELEVSEAGLMINQPQTLKIINDLHSQGIQLAIDNFGTGSSSFAALKHFPLISLKIDKIFIKEIPSSFNDMTITTTIINMAHNLGFKVLAKGVETAEQLAFLQKQGCDRYQGFFYSEALTTTAFIKLLRKTNGIEIAGN